MVELFPIINRRRADTGEPRPMHVIACSRCPSQHEISAHNGRLPIPHLTGTFQRHGWRVSRSGQHVCPACQAKDAAARRTARISKTEEKLMATNASKAASPKASSAIVDLYMLIDDKYLRDKKAYIAGYSDERIAKELDLAVPVVVERRERDFGPLVVDTTLDDLTRDVAGLTADMAAIAVPLKDVDRLLTQIRARAERLDKVLVRMRGAAGAQAV